MSLKSLMEKIIFCIVLWISRVNNNNDNNNNNNNNNNDDDDNNNNNIIIIIYMDMVYGHI